MKVFLIISLAIIGVVSGATQPNEQVPVKQAETTAELLSTLDADIFDATNADSDQKYKRALSELDLILGTITKELETAKKQEVDVAKPRTKREAGGWGGWGEEQHVEYHHAPVYHHSYPVYHHHGHHHRRSQITPELLLRTALILKGILLLGHFVG